jgi:xanthine dehydrogenase accessory factor
MKTNRRLSDLTIVIRGGGEVASAVAHRLARCHFRVCLTEVPYPQAVSRGVAFCEAIYDGEKEVEGIVAKSVGSTAEVFEVWAEDKIPIMVDPEASIKDSLHPEVLIDAIMAKRNLGTKISAAPLVIGMGPGFRVGRDAHVVVETNYSMNLGKVILSGEAEKDTKIPIPIAGLTFARALHAPKEGLFSSQKNIGDSISSGEVIAFVGGQPVKAEVGGILRGLLRNRLKVKKGTKLGEIDPLGSKEDCYIIRPKMRAIAGGALEATLMHCNRG